MNGATGFALAATLLEPVSDDQSISLNAVVLIPHAGCLACWCPCIAYSRVRTRYKHLNTRGTAHPDGGDGCGSDCFIHYLTACIGVACLLQVRSSLQDTHPMGAHAIVCRCGTVVTSVLVTTSRVEDAETSALLAAVVLVNLPRRAVSSSLRSRALVMSNTEACQTNSLNVVLVPFRIAMHNFTIAHVLVRL